MFRGVSVYPTVRITLLVKSAVAQLCPFVKDRVSMVRGDLGLIITSVATIEAGYSLDTLNMVPI